MEHEFATCAVRVPDGSPHRVGSPACARAYVSMLRNSKSPRRPRSAFGTAMNGTVEALTGGSLFSRASAVISRRIRTLDRKVFRGRYDFGREGVEAVEA